jgi:enediyne biosynthesis protein E4
MQTRLLRQSAFLILLSVVLVGAVRMSRPARLAASRPLVSPQPPSRFIDIAARAGLNFVFNNGHKNMATMMEESGSGCAIFDYDGDGWPDLYLLNGRDLYGRGLPASRNALYHNNGDGTFTDVTDKAGVPGTGYGIGVVAGDYDNDGHPDLYVCQWGKNVLYHNNGDGTFTDVTDKAGVGGMDFGESFHTGAAWLDYDRDGRLDLYVCSYVKFRRDGKNYCSLTDGTLSNCPPSAYEGTPSLLFHNNGDGTFTNVTRQAGVYFAGGKALSALTCDPDDDGWTSLFVGHDGEEARLLRNDHHGRFTNIAPTSGVAFAQDGATIAAMGIDFGDYRNEGRPGLFIADFSRRPDHLWRNQGAGLFMEESTPSHVADATFEYLGFGAGFLDYDNDGWLDLFIANGHVYPEVEHSKTGEHYLQPCQLLHNERNGQFRETTHEAGEGFALLHAGRGAAFGDLFNDGNMDVLVNNNDGPPTLLRNQGGSAKPAPHWISLQLIGTRSNRDAIGARVFLTAGGMRQRRDQKSGGSYLSSSDPRLHFGLGSAATVDSIEVRWPSGLKQEVRNLSCDTFYTLREGDNAPVRQPIRGMRGEPKQ